MEKIYDFITGITFLNALVFGSIFLCNPKKNDPLRILGVFLIVYVGVNLQWLLDDIRLLPFSFSFLIVPVFYVYIKKVLGVFTKKDYWHFLPGIVEFLFTTSVLIYFNGSGEVFFRKETAHLKIIFFFILPTLYNIGYAILSVFLILKCKKLITIIFTDIERKRLYWLVITCFILIISYVLELLSIAGLLYTDLDMYLFLYQAFSACFIVYWVAIYGLNQKSLQLQTVMDLSDHSNVISEVLDKSNDHKRSSVHKEHLTEEKYQMIVSFFNDTKIYKNKDVSLFMVADLLPLSYRDVSRLINTFGNKNFSQFVNEFRIAESKQLLLSDFFEKYSLSSIGDEVGFNSRATFFAAFKSIVGMTPLEYRKKFLENRDSESKNK